MPIEVEAKFLNINRDELRDRLKATGFACQQANTLMRRVVFDTPNSDGHSWARVRDEGNAIKITYKRTHDITRVDGTEEIEIKVCDFNKASQLLSALGLIRKSYQETWREIWQRDAVEVVLDEWPGIPPFTEIEGPDETQVRAVAAELGFDWNKALFGAVGVVYETIGISHKAINAAPLITFDNVSELLSLRNGPQDDRDDAVSA